MKKNKDAEEKLKEIEKAVYAIKFYPVVVDEQSKEDAMKKIISLYNSGEDTVKQMVLYMVHESLAKQVDLVIGARFWVFHVNIYGVGNLLSYLSSRGTWIFAFSGGIYF